MTDTSAQNRPLPRSYMPEEEKEGLSQNLIYCSEASAAIHAGDEDAAWAWMSMAKIPEFAKLAMADTFGREFMESRGFSFNP
jgi:hypothetical protein